jgi:hypothetical protein
VCLFQFKSNWKKNTINTINYLRYFLNDKGSICTHLKSIIELVKRSQSNASIGSCNIQGNAALLEKFKCANIFDNYQSSNL